MELQRTRHALADVVQEAPIVGPGHVLYVVSFAGAT